MQDKGASRYVDEHGVLVQPTVDVEHVPHKKVRTRQEPIDCPYEDGQHAADNAEKVVTQEVPDTTEMPGGVLNHPDVVQTPNCN